jgi:hypothetical protein
MIVYVVLHGERCEGGSVISIHKNRATAVSAALNTKCCFEGGWKPDPENGDYYWLNGCDFVCVEKYEVKP